MNLRNIAVIAHVDHGKTTLVDAFLKQSQTFGEHQSEMSQELIMDSGDQEKERGITITAKITAINYNDTQVNIIDTPGHADFGGEVERTLHMADGCLLIVDAQEGPMPQTKFVLSKALQKGLRPIVVINKIDKPAARVSEVEDEVADLFLELAVDEDQLHYTTLYSVGRDGKAWRELPDSPNGEASITPILDTILDVVPAPDVSKDGGLQLLATSLEWDNYEGKMVIGRVERGAVEQGQSVLLIDPEQQHGQFRIDKLYGFYGLGKTELKRAEAGQIVALTGVKDAQIGQTITSTDHPDAMPTIELEPPTLSIYLGPNTSPLKGREGKFTTSRQINERLEKELETNLGLQVEKSGIGSIIKGRGELHLSVLVESMRREGYEFELGRPEVVMMEQPGGQTMEPYELLTVEVPSEHANAVNSELSKRLALPVGQTDLSDSAVRLEFRIATRNLLGARSLLVTATKGTAIMSSISDGYEPKGKDLNQQRNGALIAWEQGTATPYSLQSAEARGTLFIEPGTTVYGGMIVGLSNQRLDLEINVTKEKHLNNMRSKSSDGTVVLTPATILSLEQSIDFLEQDELLEVTPQNLRLRKRELDPKARKRQKS